MLKFPAVRCANSAKIICSKMKKFLNPRKFLALQYVVMTIWSSTKLAVYLHATKFTRMIPKRKSKMNGQSDVLASNIVITDIIIEQPTSMIST